MSKVINVRGMDCEAEVEKKFNEWYNEVHIPMLLKNAHLKSAARYKRIGDDNSNPKYLAIYEFEDIESFEKYNNSPEMAKVLEEMKQTWPTGGFESKWRIQYEEIKSWKK